MKSKSVKVPKTVFSWPDKQLQNTAPSPWSRHSSSGPDGLRYYKALPKITSAASAPELLRSLDGPKLLQNQLQDPFISLWKSSWPLSLRQSCSHFLNLSGLVSSFLAIPRTFSVCYRGSALFIIVIHLKTWGLRRTNSCNVSLRFLVWYLTF